MNRFSLLPEWSPQAAVMLTWPHEKTDWVDILERVEPVYVELAAAIVKRSHLLIVAPQKAQERIGALLLRAGINKTQYTLFACLTDDTWARDHGPLTLSDGEKLKMLDFTFNGWGEKFSADLDNQINRKLAAAQIFRAPMQTIDWVLEGGAIEIDSSGALLTTSACLLNQNRNRQNNRAEVEQYLMEYLGARKINWVDYGYLAGDDTDSHIDTLARLGPNAALLYVGCDDTDDEHYRELQQMEQQLLGLTDAEGQAYDLYRLPWPRPVFDSEGHRLPATYANFLILNDAVLVPIYDDPADEAALEIIGRAFSGYEIIGINCLPLIEQHGSLHCITMQIPEGAIEF
ncbi:agmatine/peptidylarginine deiminase [Gilvimarinus sp. DA14]|uniref:agmatine deiminase family protein n=1 Tax=Gilvimarinus sp. DA14 TaxID=2956798 RepID=UPI0020B7FD82|nr:agmatine deiminase family protein [Gilvimarinus sp. DA14]UTF60532.1 agmatine deiminase family protein [Gilvimarinus sp. DA14]